RPTRSGISSMCRYSRPYRRTYSRFQSVRRLETATEAESCGSVARKSEDKNLSRTFEALQRLEKEQQITSRPAAEVTAIVHPIHGSGSNGASSQGVKSVKVGEEEVLKLVQRVFRSTNPDAPRMVAFSGVDHGDGCSWITANAALTLAAQTSSSICVVDANLRTPSLHRFFEIHNRFGLVDAIA